MLLSLLLLMSRRQGLAPDSHPFLSFGTAADMNGRDGPLPTGMVSGGVEGLLCRLRFAVTRLRHERFAAGGTKSQGEVRVEDARPKHGWPRAIPSRC